MLFTARRPGTSVAHGLYNTENGPSHGGRDTRTLETVCCDTKGYSIEQESKVDVIFQDNDTMTLKTMEVGVGNIALEMPSHDPFTKQYQAMTFRLIFQQHCPWVTPQCVDVKSDKPARMQRLMQEELVVRLESRDDIYSFKGTQHATEVSSGSPSAWWVKISPGRGPRDLMFVEKGAASCGYVTKHLTSSFQRHEGLHKHILPCVCRFQMHCFTRRALKLHWVGTDPTHEGRPYKERDLSCHSDIMCPDLIGPNVHTQLDERNSVFECVA